jgi:hypothetical protein
LTKAATETDWEKLFALVRRRPNATVKSVGGAFLTSPNSDWFLRDGFDRNSPIAKVPPTFVISRQGVSNPEASMQEA